MPDTTCIACKSQKILRGSFDRQGYANQSLVLSDAKFKFTLSDMPAIPLIQDAFICFDCGVAWSRADPSIVQEQARKWVKDDTRNRLLIG